MEETPPPATPSAEPESPTPSGSPGRSGFAWWGWVLLAALIGMMIWYLVNPTVRG